MRKTTDVKAATKNVKNDKLDLIIEVLLDIRDQLKKQNDIIRRGKSNG